MLTLQNLTKVHPLGIVAVDDVSIRLTRGVVGLIGHNGAGKTSLINMIATLSRPTRGSILFDDHDIVRKPERLRRRLGFLPQEFGAHANLTAHDFLGYLAALKGVRDTGRIRRCLEMVNLHEFAQRRLAGFSGGMRRRLGIAQALLNDPDVLIVDEPTTGLDLDERQRFRMLMAEVGLERLVLVSTHIVSDIENIASRLAIMHKGQLVADASPQEVMAQARGKIWSAMVDAGDYDALRTRVRILQARQQAGGMQLRIAHPQSPFPGAQSEEPSLEDALMAYPHASPELAA
ncbi:MAG TPA: ATP-binding cassette domain-containing protein [Xanthomonadaceae bacterium]